MKHDIINPISSSFIIIWKFPVSIYCLRLYIKTNAFHTKKLLYLFLKHSQDNCSGVELYQCLTFETHYYFEKNVRIFINIFILIAVEKAYGRDKQ